MQRVTQAILEKSGGREVVLYGASGMAEALCEMMETFGVVIPFFVDRESHVFHHLVRSVELPKKLDPQKYFPIIVPFGSQAITSIIAHLTELGYAQNDWFIWAQDVDYDIVFNGIVLGKHFQLSKSLTLYSAKRYIKSVGRYASIEHSFKYATDHPFSLSTSNYMPCLELTSPNLLEIGADVWIGANVFVNCSKVRSIGCGAVIAAGAVVIEDVPPYAVVAGVPAKIKKYRFSPEEIEILLKVKWWDWTNEKILENSDCFMDYKVFFKRFG